MKLLKCTQSSVILTRLSLLAPVSLRPVSQETGLIQVPKENT